jgi:hypothetical protein
MWQTREIERVAEKRLISEYGESRGQEIFARYLSARSCLVEDVLREIKTAIPDYTDHGPDHVANVLDNAGKLLGEDAAKLTSLELYSLLLSILFHDVGNILNRDDHQRRIAAIYDHVRVSGNTNTQEKLVVLKTGRAHCGTSTDGSRDTLQYLMDDVETLFEEPVSLCKVAAILRFADELAEGPHRTSQFMQVQHRYPLSSRIFHEYASMTNICIDRKGGRIAVQYNVKLDGHELSGKKEKRLRDTLSFVYKRVDKLNQERQYARHYCDLLSPFKSTSVSFNFWRGKDLLDVGLGRVQITDLVIPGEKHKCFQEYDTSYKLDKVIRLIRRTTGGGAKPASARLRPKIKRPK